MRLALTLAVILALLAACGDEAEGPAAGAAAATPDAAAPAATPETEGDDGAPEAVEAAALSLLAAEVGAAESAFSLDSAMGMGWSDASLGCPQEGFAYAQVLTPGYKLLYSLDGAVYAVHTNEDGSHAVVCEDAGAPEAAAPAAMPETEGSPRAPEAIQAAALARLAAEVGAAETAFSLDSARGMAWPDASLGCPQEGFAYAQGMTLGYKFLFSYEGAVYAVHTNVDGSHAVVCEDGAG